MKLISKTAPKIFLTFLVQFLSLMFALQLILGTVFEEQCHITDISVNVLTETKEKSLLRKSTELLSIFLLKN